MTRFIILVSFFFWASDFMAQSSSKTGTATTLPIPEAVQLKFSAEFPAIQPKWEIDDKNYKALYADPKTNSKGIILYDPEGKVIRRDTEINATTPE